MQKPFSHDEQDSVVDPEQAKQLDDVLQHYYEATN
jgi:hypothetical protein